MEEDFHNSFAVLFRHGLDERTVEIENNNLCIGQSAAFLQRYTLRPLNIAETDWEQLVNKYYLDEITRTQCFNILEAFHRQESKSKHRLSTLKFNQMLTLFAERSTGENACLIDQSRGTQNVQVLDDLALASLINEFVGYPVCESYQTELPRLTRSKELDNTIGNYIVANEESMKLEVILVRVNEGFQAKVPFTLMSFTVSYGQADAHATMLLINHQDKTYSLLDPNGIEWCTTQTRALEQGKVLEGLGFAGQRPKVYDTSDLDVISKGLATSTQRRLEDSILGLQEGICKPLSKFMLFLSVVFGGTPWLPLAMILQDNEKRNLVKQSINGFYQSFLLYLSQQAFRTGSLFRAPTRLAGGSSQN